MKAPISLLFLFSPTLFCFNLYMHGMPCVCVQVPFLQHVPAWYALRLCKNSSNSLSSTCACMVCPAFVYRFLLPFALETLFSFPPSGINRGGHNIESFPSLLCQTYLTSLFVLYNSFPYSLFGSSLCELALLPDISLQQRSFASPTRPFETHCLKRSFQT